ncbi:DUF2603 domain-containing protein [Helicobacter saguini]|uniref:DUF2603 domain-containing protein n=2 Tax=Helicobacter saguini TaxID=1548018 RepID=A0A347W0D6_9HELI|nr:DUF2603 domain-containing protein [Helicobacter saguini]MWV66708.1 DUF2603 domain-containing protein [Helicobacter saguini]MWV69058.1 DUF2603 domain-containing protein [Helicobacter saguini]MWV71388.1 DUF2603 domain-containing protein [Helicobacter saguini]TLD94048.1 DUF2603 domain-containing protein [Helicobacter saguini]
MESKGILDSKDSNSKASKASKAERKDSKYDPQKLAASLNSADNIAYLKGLDNDTFALRFVHGSLQENEATFIKSEEGDEFVMLPKEAITHILSILQDTREESLKIMLRYAIRDLMPFDLEDAMAVALSELESQRLDNGNLPFIDMKILAKKVRLKHPNLFFA